MIINTRYISLWRHLQDYEDLLHSSEASVVLSWPGLVDLSHSSRPMGTSLGQMCIWVCMNRLSRFPAIHNGCFETPKHFSEFVKPAFCGGSLDFWFLLTGPGSWGIKLESGIKSDLFCSTVQFLKKTQNHLNHLLSVTSDVCTRSHSRPWELSLKTSAAVCFCHFNQLPDAAEIRVTVLFGCQIQARWPEDTDGRVRWNFFWWLRLSGCWVHPAKETERSR